MARLSNFFRPRDQAGTEADLPAIYRPAQREELESALRLILVNDQGLAGDETVLEFLAFAVQRHIDVNRVWIALVDGRIVWALLPILSPGHTMLLFTPSRIPRATPSTIARNLVGEVCSYWGARDMELAQFLLDPADRAIRELYSSCGFEELAELIYLQRNMRDAAPEIALPAGVELVLYSEAAHARFARTILRSYQGSLDCPALNGRREIEGVIAGHKATGEFDPSLWFLASENGQDCGVLILSRSHNANSLELVYLGLAPEARGRGMGDGLMRLALASVVGQERSELTLAVDSRNTPALRLYYRHGMKRIGSRVALIKSLRAAKGPSQSGQIGMQS